MPRPKCCRRIAREPGCVHFKPAGIPARDLEVVILEIDELEAIRLADLGGLYHEKAAEQMNVSRQTFGRIISSARKKVAQALVEGMVLRIEGGEIEMTDKRKFTCLDCQHNWEVEFGTGRPLECPECKSSNFHRSDGGQGPAGSCVDGRPGQGKGRRMQRHRRTRARK